MVVRIRVNSVVKVYVNKIAMLLMSGSGETYTCLIWKHVGYFATYVTLVLYNIVKQNVIL